MEVSHLFSILSVIGAVLFFSAGFSLALLTSKRAEAGAGVTLEQDWAVREAALRESVLRESAAREAVLRESVLRESAAREQAAEVAARESAGRSGESDAHLKSAASLDAECTRLRSDTKAAAAEIARLKAALAELEHRPAKNAVSLPPAQLDGIAGSTSFQGILGRLSKIKGMRAAVLGDALGLPVASFGEQSESLAGFCGFISQAASKARDFLQIESIRRIVIEDERLATVTACSITGSDIFLATLTSGPGPDFVRMIQVLNEVKSFMSQRSRA